MKNTYRADPTDCCYLKALPGKIFLGIIACLIGYGPFYMQAALGQSTYASQNADPVQIVDVAEEVSPPTGIEKASTQRISAVPTTEDVAELGQTVSLDLQEATLEEALNYITAQTELKVAYLRETIPPEKTVTVAAEAVTVREALRRVLRETNLRLMQATEGQLVLLSSSLSTKRKAGSVSAKKRHIEAQELPSDKLTPLQQGTIDGTVTDASTGEPLPGVNVVIEGIQQGSSTGANGSYEITGVEAGTYTVRASFVGYQNATKTGVEVNEGEATTVDFALQPATQKLEDLVVVGYGEQEQGDLTGAISSVSSQDIEDVPVTNVVDAIQGKVAGVNITRGGWSPASGNTIRIRGTRSITAGNEPLIVVDGAPWQGAVGDLNPSNVASIEVLKGPSATAIYGSRGANGVIEISTKEGTSRETTVSFNSYMGAQRPYRTLDLMNSQEWLTTVDQAYENAEVGDTPQSQRFTPAEIQGIENGVDMDWQDAIFRTGIQQDYNVQMSGGSDQTSFLISPGFYEQEGIIKGEQTQKYTLQGKVGHQFNNKFDANLSVFASRTLNDYMPGSVLQNAMYLPPVVDPYDEEGDLVLLPHGENVSPNPLADIQNMVQERTRDRIHLSLSANYEILPSLTYDVQFTPEIIHNMYGEYAGSITSANVGAAPTAMQSENRTFHYTLNNILRFQKTFADQHDVGLTFVNTLEEDRVTSLEADVRGLPFNSQYYGLGSAEDITGAGSDLTEWSLLSFAGRMEYHFSDKYLFTMTGRADGSSRLAEGNKWSFFPSAALGWRVSEEPFMEPVEGTISNLKLRVEYGMSGNTSISPYQVQGGLGRVPYAFGDAAAFGYQVSSLSNPSLSWERTTQLNVGMDLSLWENRVSATADYYRQHTSNLLLERQLPTSTGFSGILTNVGATRNVGFEFSLSSLNVNAGDFQWRTKLNFSTNRNEIVELYGDGGDNVANEWFIGEPISVYFDHEFGGIWQEDEAQEAAEYGREPGEIKVVDKNNDGAVNDEDRTILGSSFPDWTGGMTNTFSYKNVDLSFVLNVVQGRMIYNDWQSYFLPANTRFNMPDVDYWRPSDPSNKWPRPDQSLGQDPTYAQLLNYADGSYLRIRRITLGYTLPSNLTQSLGGESWRIYATAQNPYVFSSDDLIGFDPENANSPGQSPSYRTFLFGVNLTF